jgi:hypothetical protein
VTAADDDSAGAALWTPAGVCLEAYELVNPSLCVISDGPFSDTSSNVYSGLATDARVNKGGSIIPWPALSTTKDGTVEIAIGATGWTVEIDS